MAAVLAGEAAVRIVPTLKGFHSAVKQGIERQPHHIDVKVNPDFTSANAQMAGWRKLQESNAVKVPVKVDFQTFQRDLSQVEHIFKTSSLNQAVKLNIKVIGLDALPALAYAAGSAASGLDALGKSAFALPGIIGGALASVGALAVGLNGVADAFKAYSDASKNAADDARKARDADRDLASSKRNLQNAIRDQRREIQDLNRELRRSSLSEADAALSIQEDMERLQAGNFKSITEYQRAQLSLMQSIDRYNTLRQDNVRLAEDTARANAQGVQGSDRVADALDRVAKATEAINAASVSDLSIALQKLSPNARSAVEALHGFADEWKNVVQLPTQDALFAGMDKTLSNLAKKTLPTLGSGLSGVASGLNQNLTAVANALGSDRNVSLFDRIFGNTRGGLQNASRGMQPLIDGFTRLTEVSSKFLPRLGDAAATVFGRFENFITRIADDGSLERWINQGFEALTSLGNTFINLGSIVSSIADSFNAASGTTGGFFGSLERGTKTLADFLKSTEGRNTLVSYFNRAKEFTNSLIDALRNAKNIVGDIVDTAREWSQGFLGVVGALASMASWIERNTGLLKPLLAAYLTLKTAKPVIEALTSGWKNYSTIMDAVAKQGGSGGVVQNAFVGAKNKMADLGKEAGTAAEKAGGAGKVSLLGSLKNVGGYIGPGLAFSAAIVAITAGITEMGEAHKKAAQDADTQKASLDQLKGSIDAVTGSATTATLGQNAKELKSSYAVPGLGNRNVSSDIARLGIAGVTEQSVLASTLPTQQATRDTTLGALDKATESKIASSEEWKRFGETWQKNGVSLSTLAKAANGDPGAKAAVEAAERNMLNGKSRAEVGSGVGGQQLLATKTALGDLTPSLTDVVTGSGAYDSASTAAFIRDKSQGAIDQGNLVQGAGQLANGKGVLSPAGAARFGQFGATDGHVFLTPEGTAIIKTDREPSIDPALGSVERVADGWQIRLSIDGTGQFVQKLAAGGKVGGVGTGTSDSNITALSRGEFVTRKAAVDYYGDGLFEALNSKSLPKFNVGGGFGLPRQPVIAPVPRPTVPVPAPVPVSPRQVTGANPALAGLTPRQVLNVGAGAPIPNRPVVGPSPVRPVSTPVASNTRAWYDAYKPVPKPVAPAVAPKPVSAPKPSATPAAKSGGASPTHSAPRTTPGTGNQGHHTHGGGIPTLPGPISTGVPMPAGLSMAGTPMAPGAMIPLPIGGRTGSESGLQVNTIRAKRAVETMFPQISTIGGYRQDALHWHPDGLALDIMIPNHDTPEGKAYGDQIWQWAQANAEQFGFQFNGESIWQDGGAHQDHIHLVTNGGGYPTGAEQYMMPGLGLAPGGNPLALLQNSAPGAVPGIQGALTGKADPGKILENLWKGFLGIDQDSSSEGGDLGGLGHLTPKKVTGFLGEQAKDIGSGLMSVGMQLLQGFTGLDLSSVVSGGQQIGNHLLGGEGEEGSGSSDGTGLNDLAGANMDSFLSGGLPVGLSQDLGLTGGGAGGGAEQWRETVRSILQQLAPKYGITNLKAWEDAIVKQIDTESGGNPQAFNGNDTNGRGGTQQVAGIGQFLKSTFDAHNISGGDYMDPVAQIYAMVDYVASKYGMDESGAPKQIGRGVGYKSGGHIKGPGTGRSDSSLARVSRGEWITRAAAVNHYGPALFSRLNNMQIPRESLPGFNGGGYFPPLQPAPIPAPAPPPVPAAPPPPPAPGAPGGQAVGQLPLPSPAATVGVAGPSTGGAPGPGATAPAPTPGALPQAGDALSQAAGSLAGGLGGVSASGGYSASQPGAEGSNQADQRGVLGAAPTSTEHNNPALKQGVEGAFSTIGALAGTAAQMGMMAGTMGASAAAGPASGAVSSLIAGGAQVAGQAASAGLNVLSSLMVGTLTGGSTGSASGVPMLPQQQQQSGVPMAQQINQQTYNVSSMDTLARTQEQVNAATQMPHIGRYGA